MLTRWRVSLYHQLREQLERLRLRIDEEIGSRYTSPTDRVVLQDIHDALLELDTLMCEWRYGWLREDGSGVRQARPPHGSQDT